MNLVDKYSVMEFKPQLSTRVRSLMIGITTLQQPIPHWMILKFYLTTLTKKLLNFIRILKLLLHFQTQVVLTVVNSCSVSNLEKWPTIPPVS